MGKRVITKQWIEIYTVESTYLPTYLYDVGLCDMNYNEGIDNLVCNAGRN